MKKITSLLMVAVLLVTMFSAFAFSASAEPLIQNGEYYLSSGDEASIEESAEYDSIFWSEESVLTVKEGVTLTVDDINMNIGGTLIIENGARVIVGKRLALSRQKSKLDIHGGLLCNNPLDCSGDDGVEITLHPTAYLDLTLNGGCTNLYFALSSDDILVDWQQNRICTQHSTHNFKNSICNCGAFECVEGNQPHKIGDNGICTVCGSNIGKCEHIKTNTVQTKTNKMMLETVTEKICKDCGKVLSTNTKLSEINPNVTASVLSDGSLAIITAIAGVAVGMAVMFFIMKKKKPALASGVENKDEE